MAISPSVICRPPLNTALAAADAQQVIDTFQGDYYLSAEAVLDAVRDQTMFNREWSSQLGLELPLKERLNE